MNKRVLVVDDDRDYSRLIALALKRKGYEVIEAETTTLANAFVSVADLMILDINLGEENGFDFLRDIRDEGCCTPAFMISGIVDSSRNRLAREYTNQEILPKPFELHELYEKVDNTLKDF